jgi:steroid delta-isomerase-like uncharacterized protein
MAHLLTRPLWLVSVLAALAACSCEISKNTTRSPSMHPTTADENQAIVRTLFEDCFNRGKLDLLEQLISPNFLPDYVGARGARGREAFQFIVGLRTAFPDIHYTIDDLVAAGDKVALRWHWTGTHRGEFRGVPASQKPVSTTGAGIFRLRDRKIIGASLETDRLGFLQQLAVIPADDQLLKPPR